MQTLIVVNAKVGSSELQKQVYFVVVITVASLLFPESSERAKKLLFW